MERGSEAVKWPHGVWEMKWVMHMSFGGKEVEDGIMGLREGEEGSGEERENKGEDGEVSFGD